MARSASYYSLIVPPVEFQDLKGVLHGVQSGKISDADSLDALRDIATKRQTPTANWNKYRNVFLNITKEFAEKRAAQAEADKLGIEDVYFDRDSRIDITYKSKLRIVIRNCTAHTIDVGKPKWEAGRNDVSFQKPFASSLEIEGTDGWKKNHWQGERDKIQVQPDQVFRLWIGLDQSPDNEELRRRHETLRLGSLELPIKISGYDVTFRNEF